MLLRLNVHNNKFSFNSFAVIFQLRHSQITLNVQEELLNFSTSYLISFKCSRLFSPYFFEFTNIILESVEHIIVWKIVQVELLKNNEDEQVDHDVLLDDHEQDVEDKRKYSSAVYTRDAVSIFVHAVKHDNWPIFSRWKPQHHYKGVRKGREIHVVINLFAWSYSSEEEDTEDWEDEVNEGK